MAVNRRQFLQQSAGAIGFASVAPLGFVKKKHTLRVLGTHVTLQEEIRQRAQKDLGKVADKYTIVSKSTNQLDVLVGNGMVNIYTSDRKLNGDNLEKALLELLDLEKLAELMK